jgi:cobalt-zinc-cadmium efflux system outer membrane protein
MAESDLLRVKLEADRLALSANSARLDLNRATVQLFREMGSGEFPEVRMADALEPREDRLIDANLEAALSRRPEVELSRTAVEEARSRLALQQATARPNYDVLFGYKRATGYDTLIAGLQVDLPFFNRNQGNVETATAEVRVAQANAAATEALIRAEVRAAALEYELRRRQVREFLGKFREQAAETSRIAQAAYRLGGADLLRLLDAERLRIEIELQNERAWMEYRQSIVQLETALGVNP